MTLMKTYSDDLNDEERAAIEEALDTFKESCGALNVRLAGDDRAARAAEALAVYLHSSRN